MKRTYHEQDFLASDMSILAVANFSIGVCRCLAMTGAGERRRAGQILRRDALEKRPNVGRKRPDRALVARAAHKTFSGYAHLQPNDPVGPASDAAAYLFAEMDRLHILQSEFFTHDDNFRHPKKLNPDRNARQAFNLSVAQSEKLAGSALASSPQDRNALFASLLVHGLRSDYDGLIDKRYLTALTDVKTGRQIAEKLLTIDPTFYDAHLAVGVENYMLSLKTAPLRWFLQLAGAETDRTRGLERLRITAQKGNYLKPYARLLLAVAALRDMDKMQAREILQDLTKQFPHNHLYAEELARLP